LFKIIKRIEDGRGEWGGSRLGVEEGRERLRLRLLEVRDLKSRREGG